jgi:hypothetical protein
MDLNVGREGRWGDLGIHCHDWALIEDVFHAFAQRQVAGIYLDNKIQSLDQDGFDDERRTTKGLSKAGLDGYYRGLVDDTDFMITGLRLGLTIFWDLFMQGYTGTTMVGIADQPGGYFVVGMLTGAANGGPYYMKNLWTVWESDYYANYLPVSAVMSQSHAIRVYMQQNIDNGRFYWIDHTHWRTASSKGISSCAWLMCFDDERGCWPWEGYNYIDEAVAARDSGDKLDFVLTWTVDEYWLQREVINKGADGMITNLPSRLISTGHNMNVNWAPMR